MNTKIVVSAVIWNKNKVLLCKKPDNTGPYPNCWHFPGGGVLSESESLEDAIQREILEETNVTVKDLQPLSFSEDQAENKHGELTHYYFFIFCCNYDTGEVRPGDDIVTAQWFTSTEVPVSELTKPSQTVFKKYYGIR